MQTFNFEVDLRHIVETVLNSHGVQWDANVPLEDLMLLLFNHEAKTIATKPRKVHESKKFEEKKAALSLDMIAAVESILSKFRTGEDVSGHLSRASTIPSQLDGLIADWGVHHIHISTTKKNSSDTFFDRTGPVMFAKVTDTDAYFIDIYPHGKAFPETWTRVELLDIIDQEWPELLDPYTLKGFTATPSQMGALDLKKLRAGGTYVVHSVGNRVIVPPGGGLATDGKTPNAHIEKADYIRRIVRNLQDWLTNNLDSVTAAIEREFGVSKSEQHYKLVPLQNGWGVVESKSNILVQDTSPKAAAK